MNNLLPCSYPPIIYNNIYRCKKCARSFNYKEKLLLHYDTYHKNNSICSFINCEYLKENQ